MQKGDLVIIAFLSNKIYTKVVPTRAKEAKKPHGQKVWTFFENFLKVSGKSGFFTS
jgi:hypothetical protein